MGGISVWQLLIIAVIVALLFGTKKLRNMGGDLGSAVKGFKNAISDEDKPNEKSVDEEATDSLANKKTSEAKTLDKEKDQA